MGRHAAANARVGLRQRDAGIVDVLPQTAVLLGFAAVLLSIASWRLRRTIMG